MTPPTGPRCERCGCTAVEHERLVDEKWCLVGGRCLTCNDCDGFQLEPGTEEVRDVVRVA